MRSLTCKPVDHKAAVMGFVRTAANSRDEIGERVVI
jgi:hypothetical protein